MVVLVIQECFGIYTQVWSCYKENTFKKAYYCWSENTSKNESM